MTQKLGGIIIPAITPFRPDESLDLDALAANLDRTRDTGVSGFMVLGTNGEFKGLDDDESRAVISTAAQAKGDRLLIAGVARESLHHTLSFIDSLKLGDVDYVSLLTPNYFPKLMDAAALIDYYVAVADRSPVPVLIYIIPGSANGVVMPPAALAELADHPNIAGVKDTSPNMLTDYMLAAGGRDDFTVLAGSLNTIMTDLAFGGPGGVISAANYLPAECARLIELYDDPKAAQRYYALLRKAVKATGGRRGVASVKAAMNVRGFSAGIPRRPIAPLGEDEIAAIKAGFDTYLPQLHSFR